MASSERQQRAKDTPNPGEIVDGKYRIERVIGEGGMGVVLAAHHLFLDQRVAVKMIHPAGAESSEAVPRLLREARAAVLLRSEHVVRVMDVAVHTNGMPFIVMEYLEGRDLQTLLNERGALPVQDVCDYMLQALVALAEAHAHGVIHRDLKPSNLFLARRPKGGTLLKILDFGVAKSTSLSSERVRLTASGAIMGSPVYMSPEQIRGTRDIDARSDVWSLGVVAYELLTGVLPFPGETIGAVFASILESSVTPMPERRPEIPAALDAVVARCLSRKREERFSTAAELARALAPFAPPSSRSRVTLIEEAEAAHAEPAEDEKAPDTLRGSPPAEKPGAPAPLAGTDIVSTAAAQTLVTGRRQTGVASARTAIGAAALVLAAVVVYAALRPPARTPATPASSAFASEPPVAATPATAASPPVATSATPAPPTGTPAETRTPLEASAAPASPPPSESPQAHAPPPVRPALPQHTSPPKPAPLRPPPQILKGGRE